MTKRQDRVVRRRTLHAIPDPQHDSIAGACGISPVSFDRPIPADAVCHYCGRDNADTRDHIVPRAKRGTDAWWNLVPCCEPCNRHKTDADTTCHCAFCTRAVFLFELGHMRPEKSPRSFYMEKPIPKPKRRAKTIFDIKAPPLPDDLSLPPSFPGST